MMAVVSYVELRSSAGGQGQALDTDTDNPRGSLVVDATGNAVVIGVEVAVGNEEQSAATTKATWRSGDGRLRETFVTLRCQPDGRLLVTAEMAQLRPADR
jgi:hypothetical protein